MTFITPASQTACRQRFRIVCPRLWLFAFNALLGVAVTTAQETGPPTDEAVVINAGIDGVFRPGHWTAIQRPADQMAATAVETLDGDGARVRYQQPQPRSTSWMYAVPGSPNAPLALLDDAGKALLADRFRGRQIEPQMPWVVAIGDTLGIDQIGSNALLKRESSVAVSEIRDAAQLPDLAIGFSGVDLIALGPSGLPVLQSLTAQQSDALVQWVQQGGRLLLSIGDAAKPLGTAAPWLNRLLPFDLAALPSARIDPAAIETFTSSQTQLPILQAVELPPLRGTTLISGRNAARQPARLAVQYLSGFGRVTVLAPALDSSEMVAWPQQSLLVSRLSGTLFANELESRRETRAGTSVGYDDFAGQVRAALDRFEVRRRVPYSIASLLLIALAALIGPLDYLLVNRLLGRPLLGWLTFPLAVLLISSVVLLLGRPRTTASDDVALIDGPFCNRLQIIDVNTKSDPPLGRGWALTHVSSVDSAVVDYAATTDLSLVDGKQLPAAVSAPFGYPSTTFGGISIIGEDTRLPAYDVELSLAGGDATPGSEAESASGVVSSAVRGVPLPPGGSKAIATRWTFPPRLQGTSDLHRKRGSELLSGSLTNPLPVDILNGALVFGEWVYLLPTRLKAGQRIENIESLRQKNFRWLLSRREAIENSSRADAWDVEMVDDLARINEVLMFDAVLGGRDYTGLANRPLGDLDLTYALTQDNAVLWGQLEKPGLDVALPVQRAATSAVRVILPVDPPRLPNE